MNAREPNPTDLISKAPPGFAMETQGPDAILIRHTRTGMACVTVFLGMWLAFWTVGCVLLLIGYLRGGKMDDGSPIPLWFVLIFWAAEVGVGALLLNLLFGQKSYRLDAQALTVETRVLLYVRRKQIPKSSIHRLVQIKTEGDDQDSIPSWGLRIEGKRNTTLFFSQPYETSRWLGQILARWAGVEFVSVPKG